MLDLVDEHGRGQVEWLEALLRAAEGDGALACGDEKEENSDQAHEGHFSQRTSSWRHALRAMPGQGTLELMFRYLEGKETLPPSL